MKITIDIDCTPEEARQFLGLADLQKFQAAALEAMQTRVTEQIASMDPDALLKNWLPAGFGEWEGLRQSFMKGFASASSKDGKRS